MAKKKAASPLWISLKSGARKCGEWYASQYPKGWYFYYLTATASYGKGQTGPEYKLIGPFKTFEAGLPAWEKAK